MILGAICCRGGSKGVPGKNTRLLNGKPLIAYTIDTARHCSMLDDIIVSTDNQKIADIAIEYSARVPFMRPPTLATDEASKWPVFLHAVETYEQLYNKTVSYIVDMDVTVPLKTTADIDGAIKLALQHPETDVVITGYTPEKNPYFNMMELTKDGNAQIVKQLEEPIVRRQDAPKVYSLSGAAFVVKKSALYNYSHWSQTVCRIYEMPRERAWDIDEEIDLDFITLLLQRHLSNR